MQNVGHCLAKEGRNNCGWCLVGAQTVSVGCRCDGSLQQAVVALNGGQNVNKECHKLQVAACVFARCQQQGASVGSETPVVVLARTVDSLKWLLVKQNNKTVFLCNIVHKIHYQLVLVVRKVGLAKNRRQLKLVRRNLVVTGFQRNAKAVALNLKVAHKGCHTRRNGAKIVVVQLLVLRRLVAHKRAASEHKVGTGGVKVLVNKEILLFPAQIREHLLNFRVEHLADWHCGVRNGVQSLFQRCLIVKRFACVRDEYCRDAERVVLNEDR